MSVLKSVSCCCLLVLSLSGSTLTLQPSGFFWHSCNGRLVLSSWLQACSLETRLVMSADSTGSNGPADNEWKNGAWKEHPAFIYRISGVFSFLSSGNLHPPCESRQLSVAVARKSAFLSVHSSSPACDKAMVLVMVARAAQDVLVPALHTCIVSRHVHTAIQPVMKTTGGSGIPVGVTSCWVKSSFCDFLLCGSLPSAYSRSS